MHGEGAYSPLCLPKWGRRGVGAGRSLACLKDSEPEGKTPCLNVVARRRRATNCRFFQESCGTAALGCDYECSEFGISVGRPRLLRVAVMKRLLKTSPNEDLIVNPRDATDPPSPVPRHSRRLVTFLTPLLPMNPFRTAEGGCPTTPYLTNRVTPPCASQRQNCSPRIPLRNAQVKEKLCSLAACI